MHPMILLHIVVGYIMKIKASIAITVSHCITVKLLLNCFLCNILCIHSKLINEI